MPRSTENRPKETEYPTGVIAPTETIGEPNLPPLPSYVYERPDIEAEAQAIFEANAHKDPEKLPTEIPPMLTTADAVVVSMALHNANTMDKLAATYGEDTLRVTGAKAAFAVDAHMKRDSASIDKAYEQYEHFRLGEPLDEGFDPLDAQKSNLDAFLEPPLHENLDGSLSFDVEQSRLVLDALRLNYLYPSREGDDDIASLDVLARVAPSHIEQAFYGELLRRAGVDMSVGDAPRYN